MSTAVLLGLVLGALAVSDVRQFAARREWTALAVSVALWLAGIGLAVVNTMGVELPSLTSVLVHLVRPLGAWIP